MDFRIDSLGYKTSFTEDEDNFLRKNYLKLPVKTMTKSLNRSSCGVIGRMKKLGLIIPRELIDQRKKDSRFHVGQPSFNKGMKQSEYMSKEGIERSSTTRFKKKHKPLNSKNDWEEVKRKDSSGRLYWMIKLPTRSKLMYKHIWLWEQHNGEVLKGFNVIFKDKNSLNCVIENLECISNSELMNRNAIHRYPEELQTSIRKINKVKRQIKKIENE